jgi:lysozyme family protein
MDVEALIETAIGHEGGFVADPADAGGPTRWGVTEKVARAQGWAGSMRDYPREEAVAVYRRLYWLKPGFDRVGERAPSVAAFLFDAGVNMGPAVAVRFLQRALNVLNRGECDYADVAVDGGVGPRTLAALEGYLARRGAEGEGVLVRALNALRGERYIRLAETRPANEAFVYGWLAKRLG